jgi:ankyrin repeat protein
VVQLLLEHKGVDADFKEMLSWAAEDGHEETFQQLLNGGVNVDGRDPFYGTPFGAAAFGDPTRMMQLLLENGTDSSGIDDQGRSTLHIAARVSHIEVINLLPDLGLDVNAKDTRGQGTLHCAAPGGSL